MASWLLETVDETHARLTLIREESGVATWLYLDRPQAEALATVAANVAAALKPQPEETQQ